MRSAAGAVEQIENEIEMGMRRRTWTGMVSLIVLRYVCRKMNIKSKAGKFIRTEIRTRERERGRHNGTHSSGQRTEIHLPFTVFRFSFSSLLFTIKQNQFATKDTALEEESFLWPKGARICTLFKFFVWAVEEFLLSVAVLRISSRKTLLPRALDSSSNYLCAGNS